MPSPAALDPVLNLRLFTAGSQSSLEAARRWTGSPEADGEGSLNLLVESAGEAVVAGLARRIPAAASRFAASGLRTWFSASHRALRQAARELAAEADPLGPELEAALEGFTGRLKRPGPTLVMGILNVTPDSFSDGGRWSDPAAAVERGLELLEHGADVLDIGGESTRPGASEVPASEELRRVLPVLEALRARTDRLLSVDTRKSEVAGACLEAGADWINDVSGLHHDPAVADRAAGKPGTCLVIMHSRAAPDRERYSTDYTPEGRPRYDDVVADTLRWIRRQARTAMERGVQPGCLWIDPGFGFGKSFEQNVELLRRLREYTSAGLPVLVGTSRKSSVGRMLGDLPADQRLEGTAATVAWAAAQGAAAVRVHDVREMARVLRVADALR